MEVRGQLAVILLVLSFHHVDPGIDLGSSSLAAPLLTEPFVLSVLRIVSLKGPRTKLSS